MNAGIVELAKIKVSASAIERPKIYSTKKTNAIDSHNIAMIKEKNFRVNKKVRLKMEFEDSGLFRTSKRRDGGLGSDDNLAEEGARLIPVGWRRVRQRGRVSGRKCTPVVTNR